MKIIICLIFALLISCYDDTPAWQTEKDDCKECHDLCQDGTNIVWYTCIDKYYDIWYEAGGHRYDKAEDLIDENCEF